MAYSVLTGVQHARLNKPSCYGVIPPMAAIDPIEHDLLAGLLGHRDPAAQRVEHRDHPCTVAVQGDPDHVVVRRGQGGVQVLPCIGVVNAVTLVPVMLNCLRGALS